MGGSPLPEGRYRDVGRRDYEWNLAQGWLPPREVLNAGRMLIPFFAAGAPTVVLVLGTTVGGTMGGLVGAALFYFNPVCRFYGYRALADVPVMFFFLCATWYLVRRLAPAWDGGFGRLLWRSAAFGLLVGLATATKLSGGIGVCIGAAAFAVWGIASAATNGFRHATLRALGGLLAMGVTSCGFFVLIPPASSSAGRAHPTRPRVLGRQDPG